MMMMMMIRRPAHYVPVTSALRAPRRQQNPLGNSAGYFRGRAVEDLVATPPEVGLEVGRPSFHRNWIPRGIVMMMN